MAFTFNIWENILHCGHTSKGNGIAFQGDVMHGDFLVIMLHVFCQRGISGVESLLTE
jgi:hypothetical protein